MSAPAGNPDPLTRTKRPGQIFSTDLDGRRVFVTTPGGAGEATTAFRRAVAIGGVQYAMTGHVQFDGYRLVAAYDDEAGELMWLNKAGQKRGFDPDLKVHHVRVVFTDGTVRS